MESDAPEPVDVALGTKPNGDIPIVCTLPPDRFADRERAWQALIDQATDRQLGPGGVRFRFPRSTDVAAIATLMDLEQECCRFFTFTMTVEDGGVVLEIAAPDDAASLLDALIGDGT